MSDETRQSDFERESSRLSEGLKSCRTVMDNYRSMIGGDEQAQDYDESDMGRYGSTTGSSYDTGSAVN